MTKLLGKLNDMKRKMIATVILLLILITGMMLRIDYGVYCDYESETPIIFMNFKAYAETVLGPDSGYVRGLGDRDVTTDIERDHGAAALYPLIPFSMISSLRNDPHTWMLTVRAVIFFVFWIGLLCLYSLVRDITGRRLYALISVFMLWLTPRFFAEGTYNNKDAMALACTLMLMYTGYRFLFWNRGTVFSFHQENSRRIRWTVLFAFTAALSTNMRITGVMLYGVIGLSYIVLCIIKKEISIRNFAYGIAALILMPIFYILLTPATWHGNLLSFISYVTEQSGDFQRTEVHMLMNGQLFNSVLYPPDAFYTLRYIIVSTPPVILILTCAGIVTTLIKIRKATDSNVFYRFVILAFSLLLALTVIISRPALYNGWRHMYFMYGPLVLFAAIGVSDLTKKRNIISKCVIAVTALQLLFLAGFIGLNHPLEFSYYNFLAGKDPETKWDGDYWGVGMEYTLEQIADEYGPCYVVAPENTFLRLNYADLPDDYKLTVVPAGDDWASYLRSDYIIINSFYKNLNMKKADAEWSPYTRDNAALLYALDETDPVMEIKCGSQVLYEVYANPYK